MGSGRVPRRHRCRRGGGRSLWATDYFGMGSLGLRDRIVRSLVGGRPVDGAGILACPASHRRSGEQHNSHLFAGAFASRYPTAGHVRGTKLCQSWRAGPGGGGTGRPPIRPPLHDLLSLVPVGMALLSWPLRTRLSESRLWRESRLRTRQTLPHDYRLRFLVAAAFSFSNTAGFSLLAYAFGHEFLPDHFHHLLFVSTLSAFLAGLLARWFGRLSPKFLLLLGYGMASLSAFLILQIQTPHRPEFWAALLVLSAFTSLSYLAEDTFKSDLWPSAVRARVIAAVRAIGMAGYLGLLLWEQRAPLSHFVPVMVGTWGLGFIAAVVWWLAGRLTFQHDRPVSENRLTHRSRHNKLR